MNPYYNRNYNKEDICNILDKIKYCITNDRYTISLNENREENIGFIHEYDIYSYKQKEILLKLKVEDFCYSVRNNKRGYSHEILYVFCTQVHLYNIDGEIEVVDVYMKFNIIDLVSGSHTVIVSFHRRNKPIEYLFREEIENE